MAFTVASRRSAAARPSASRRAERAIVQCSAQKPSAMSPLLAAGAALVLVLGPNTSPAQAFNILENPVQKAQNYGNKPSGIGGFNILQNPVQKAQNFANEGKNKAQSAGETVKSSFNLGGFGNKAKSAANDAKSKLNPSPAGSIGDKAKSVADEGKANAATLANTITAKFSGTDVGDKAKGAANDAKAKLNLSGTGNIGNKTKSTIDSGADSLKNLGQDIQKEAQQRLNPAGLRVPNPGSQDPYDNKLGDAKKNTFGTSGAGKP